jgi:transcriptional regulator with XRE-family HTH domain
MELKDIIIDIRKRNNLSQEGIAEKLFVTRQAVSRWENGETTPSIETLKAIAITFNVDAATLLGLGKTPICQSCAMPMLSFDDFGSDDNNTINVEYCNHCFQGGHFTHDRSVDEMIEANLKYLDEFNNQNGTSYSEDEARIVLKEHLQTLKRWCIIE